MTETHAQHNVLISCHEYSGVILLDSSFNKSSPLPVYIAKKDIAHLWVTSGFVFLASVHLSRFFACPSFRCHDSTPPSRARPSQRKRKPIGRTIQILR